LNGTVYHNRSVHIFARVSEATIV